jgi:hypothetical protein
MTDTCHQTHLLVGMGLTICPDWPQTMPFLLSFSQVARLTGVSHQHPASKLHCSISVFKNSLSQSDSFLYLYVLASWMNTFLTFLKRLQYFLSNIHLLKCDWIVSISPKFTFVYFCLDFSCWSWTQLVYQSTFCCCDKITDIQDLELLTYFYICFQ